MPNLLLKLRCLAYAGFTVTTTMVLLGILKLAQLASGLSEREIYLQYPITWGIVATLGLIFSIGVLSSVFLAIRIHPNIQLRSKPKQYLMKVLEDPKLKLWHSEAERLLAQNSK